MDRLGNGVEWEGSAEVLRVEWLRAWDVWSTGEKTRAREGEGKRREGRGWAEGELG